MPRVYLPPAMRALAGGQEFVDAPGGSVRELIEQLERRFPGLRDRLCQEDGLRPGLSVVVDGRIAALGLLQTVGPKAEVHFLPAIGGG